MTTSSCISHHRAANQIAATSDYATSSLFWFYITGGLNHQTAHHLFPGTKLKVPHGLYLHIVKRECL